MAFIIKKGDTLPTLDAVLTTGPNSGSQSPVNLTTAISCTFVMKSVSGGVGSRLNATIYDAVNGGVRYIWQSADTTTAGSYNGEWEVSFGTGKIQTFPNDSYFSITVGDDLG